MHLGVLFYFGYQDILGIDKTFVSSSCLMPWNAQGYMWNWAFYLFKSTLS